MSAWIPRQSQPGRKRVFFMSCAMDTTKKAPAPALDRIPLWGFPPGYKETDAFFVLSCCDCCLAGPPGKFRGQA